MKSITFWQLVKLRANQDEASDFRFVRKTGDHMYPEVRNKFLLEFIL